MVVATGRGPKKKMASASAVERTRSGRRGKFRYEIGTLKGTGRRALALRMAEPESESLLFSEANRDDMGWVVDWCRVVIAMCSRGGAAGTIGSFVAGRPAVVWSGRTTGRGHVPSRGTGACATRYPWREWSFPGESLGDMVLLNDGIIGPRGLGRSSYWLSSLLSTRSVWALLVRVIWTFSTHTIL